MTNILNHIKLAKELAVRDLEAKYKRSVMGLIWLVLTPIALLSIYSLIFTHIFKVQWVAKDSGVSVGFVLPFFVGLVSYLILSDIVNSSSNLFVSKRNFILKSSFPISVIYISNLIRAAVQLLVYVFLVLALAALQSRLTLDGLLWFFLALLVFIIFLGAVSLILTSLGPFIGDISEVARLLLRILFYATPITYPIDLIPEIYRCWMWINPLACIIELLRTPIVFGHGSSLTLLISFATFSIFLFLFGVVIFKKIRGVVADVV